MIKRDEISNPDSCLNKASDDEPVFVFRGKDVCAPELVRAWCDFRVMTGKNTFDDDQIKEAQELARKMFTWRLENHGFGGVLPAMEKYLICTVGLPRSGKSTWAQRTGFPIVNPDSIRKEFHDQAFVPKAEPWVWAMAQTMVRSLFQAGHSVVILDSTNTTRKRRTMWISRDEEWSTHWKLLKTSKEVCIDRAVRTNQDDLIPVINRMHEQWEHLSDYEGEILSEEVQSRP